MAGLISRKPVVGITAGLLFGALGFLLLGIEGAQGVTAVLFTLSAYFFLFIGIISVSSGAYAFLAAMRGRKKR